MTFDEFMNAMTNEAFRKEFSAFLAEKNPEGAAEKILATIEFAASKGFTVTAEELSLAQINRKELTDEDLEQAVGGEWCWVSDSCFVIANYDTCEAIMNSCNNASEIERETREKCGEAYVKRSR